MSPNQGALPKLCMLVPLLALSLGNATGCSLTQVAARFATPILESGTLAFESETDLAFAEQAAPSNLKLLEGLILEAPKDRGLLTLASRGYATYAFGFLEHEVEVARIEAPSKVPNLERRMEDFYGRAFEYGRRALRRGLGEALLGDSDGDFELALKRQTGRDVEAMFWTAYALGSLIQLDVTNTDRLSLFPRVKAIMERVLELDESYYFGGAHMFFGVLYAQLPPGGGGDVTASLLQFDLASEFSSGDIAMLDVLRARYLAVRMQDYELYQTSLDAALTPRPEAPPGARLANEIAHQRAHFYQRNADAFFLDVPSDQSDMPLAPQEVSP